MKKRPKLCNAISEQAAIAGWAYYCFELLFLPGLLLSIAGRLNISQAAVNFFYYLLNFFFTLSIFRQYLSRSLERAGQHMARFLLAVAGGFALCWTFSYGMHILLARYVPQFVNINDQAITALVNEQPVLMLIGTAMLVPVAEECLFRGLIFSQLYPKSKPFAYAASAAAFCAVHIIGYVGSYSPAALALSFVQYIPTGLVLGWAYAHCGSIFAPICIHTAINTLAIWNAL